MANTAYLLLYRACKVVRKSDDSQQIRRGTYRELSNGYEVRIIQDE
jgi:hypothetical protein